MASSPKPKDVHVETIRGLACVLLVAYHVIGNDTLHGMRIAEPGAWRFFVELFTNVRMPLFSFISGLVFVADPRTLDAWSAAMVKKLRRLVLPLLSVSTLFWLMAAAAANAEQPPLWQVYLVAYQHFWFLQATMLIMALLLTFGALAGGGRRFASFAYLPLIALFLWAPIIEPDVFSITQAIYLAPYFLTGYLIRVWNVERAVFLAPVRRPVVLSLAGSLSLGLLALNALTLLEIVHLDFERQSVLGFALGLSTCVFLLAARPVVPPLAWIGNHSYAIYLFHVFFTAAARQALFGTADTAPRILVFTVELVIGVLAPIAVEKLLLRSRVASLVLLGIARSRRPAAGTSPVEARAG